jgi:flagellar motor switch protein FliM
LQNELNQEEIDAMVRAARAGGPASSGPAQGPRVEPWDVRRAGQIGRTQLQAITHLHEGFARSLTTALGSYLRVVFTAALVSAEHLTYREFTARIPETTYLAAIKLEPMGVSGALQLDLKIAFPIIDLLLGGEGTAVTAPREITEIEQQIVESVARIICRELGEAWKAVELEVSFDQRVDLDGAHRLMPPSEKVLSLSFEVSLMEVRGGLNLAVPVTLSHALLRKISAQWGDSRPRGPTAWRRQMQRRLLECPFPVELCIDGLSASYGELSQMQPGTLLALRKNAADPASLLVGEVHLFGATPARRGDIRAAQLLAISLDERTPAEGTPQGIEANQR